MNRFPKITSRENQKLKLARAVREGREADRIFLEGLRLGEEILKTELEIQNVLITSEFPQNDRANQLIDNFLSKRVEILEVEARIFNSISDTKTSQGLIITAEKPLTGKDFIEKSLKNAKNWFF